jgi:hypothetical protein
MVLLDFFCARLSAVRTAVGRRGIFGFGGTALARWGKIFPSNSINFLQVRLVFVAALTVACLAFLAEAALLAVSVPPDSPGTAGSDFRPGGAPANRRDHWEFNDRRAQETISA